MLTKVFMSPKTKHRLSNPYDDELILIEVEGKYLGEDDIIRFEDKYRREFD